MKPTDAEKLIMLMLSELHEKLGVESRLPKAELSLLVEHNVTWSALNSYGMMSASSEVQETLTILAMWEKIETCWEALSRQEQQEVLNRCPHLDTAPSCPGFNPFDKDNDYADIAHELRNQGRFPRHYGPRTLEDGPEGIGSAYRAMIPVYERLMVSAYEGYLFKDELCVLLDAFVSPKRPPPSAHIDYDEPDY